MSTSAHPPITIPTPRLTIRTPVSKDAAQLCSLFTNPSNFPPDSSPDSTLTPEIMEQRIARWTASAQEGKNAFLAVILTDTDEIIGFGGYNTIEYVQQDSFPSDKNLTKLTDIGIMIASVHQRKGFATEAMRAQIEYAFEELKCGVVRIETGLGNDRFRDLVRGLGLEEFEDIKEVSYAKKVEGEEGERGYVYTFMEKDWAGLRRDRA